MSSGRVARWLVMALPYGFLHLYRRWCHRQAERSLRREGSYQSGSSAGSPSAEFSVEAAIEFLVRAGWPEAAMRRASTPEESLLFILEKLKCYFGTVRPIYGLQVGNYLGVSLAAFAFWLRQIRPGSVIVGIDSGLEVEGLGNTQHYVSQILARFGLEKIAVVICVYSLKRTPAGLSHQATGGQCTYSKLACTHVLANLARVAPRAFHFVFRDGFHDGRYLRKEIELVKPLLGPDRLITIDDVFGVWPGMERAFWGLADAELSFLDTDGRVGILEKCRETHGG